MYHIDKISFLKLLQEIAVSSNESRTFEEAAQKSIDKVCEVIGWEIGHLYIVTPDQVIENTPIWHLSDPKIFQNFKSITDNYSFQFGEGLPGSVHEQRKALWIEDIVNYHNFPRHKYAEEAGLTTGFGFPVIIDDKVEVIIEFFSSTKIKADNRFMELVSLLETLLEAVLKRTRSEIALRENEQELTTIFNNVEDVIFLLSIENNRYKFVSLNSSFTYLTGLENWRIINKYMDEVLPEPLLSKVIKNLETAIESKQPVKWVESFTYPKGKLSGEMSITPLFDDKGVCNRLIGFTHDVTPWKKAQEEAKELNRQLEERVKMRTVQLNDANKDLESFVYHASHDLRAPLRSIIGFSELLKHGTTNKLGKDEKELLDFILINSKKMDTVIDDLLIYSRLSSTDLVKSDIAMNVLVPAVIKELKSPEHDKVKFEIKDLINGFGDLHLIHMVWTNYILNAIKYSGKKDNPVIEIGSFEDDMENIYYVKDNGAGFDMKFYSKLFELFQRLHSDNDFNGSGIGLATVKKIIVNHGGRVWADGEIGIGATFYFSLPKPQ
jgi:PAS domain S-box-containing protein